MSWTLDLSKYTASTMANIDWIYRKTCYEIVRRLIMRSPVGNPDLWKSKPPKGYSGGLFRNNWFGSIGTPSDQITKRKGSEGMAAVARAQAIVTTWKPIEGRSFFMTNNLPYGEELEKGHSTQAPAGMVKITMAETPGLVQEVAR
jgi:hypothetical protein